MVIGKEIKQGTVKVGKFHGWANGTIRYENGVYCYGTKKGKTVDIRLACGQENQLGLVEAAGECAYRGVFVTPMACTKKELVKVSGLTVEALTKIARDMGLIN
jgi:hypothetical protein